jgi:hypothetical protein
MLQNSAMIANLNIRNWSARKHDKAVSAEVDVAHSAQDGGRYNKMLISKTALDPLAQHAGRVRKFHYSMTLPWGDNGDRLLPAKAYMDYTKAMRSFKDECEKLTKTFVGEYPQLVTDARNRLGTMYDAGDYPDVSDIRDRFGIAVGFMPVPDAKDFRVDVGDEALEEIRAGINAAVAERQAGAVKECWNRLFTVVGALHTMMCKDKPLFKDSLIENIRDLVELVPKLNITDDQELTRMCALIERDLVVPTYMLRKSPGARADLQTKAAHILSSIAARI